jgi:hypothetical protein
VFTYQLLTGRYLAAPAGANDIGEIGMSEFWIGSILGVVVISSLAAGVAMTGDRRNEDSNSLAQACAGSSTHRQLEDTLFTVRAQSIDGFDPICGAIGSQAAIAGQPTDFAGEQRVHLTRRAHDLR